MKIAVECYAGHRGEETPRRLLFDERTVEVAEVLDQWLAPDYRYFKLLSADNVIYIVRHSRAGWELTLMEKRPDYLSRGGE